MLHTTVIVGKSTDKQLSINHLLQHKTDDYDLSIRERLNSIGDSILDESDESDEEHAQSDSDEGKQESPAPTLEPWEKEVGISTTNMSSYIYRQQGSVLFTLLTNTFFS